MFDLVRTHQRLLQFILLLLIVPSFALWGISGYTGFMDKATDVMKVDGIPITLQEIDAAAKRQADRIGVQGQIAQSLGFKQAVLDELLQQRLMGFAVKQLNLRVSNEALAQNLKRIPEIRTLYDANGNFDAAKYRQLLASNGMSVEQFEGSQRFDLMAQQLVSSVARTELPTPKLAKQITTLYGAERQIQTLQFNASDYVNKVNASEAEIQAFYQANAKLFATPEVIDVQFLVLQADPKEEAKVFGDKADLFANLTYEQADSLKPAADKLKLTIQSQKGLSRTGASNLPKGSPLGNTKVLQALFRDDAIKNKRNIEAVQISPGVFVSARVTELYPASTLPLKDVVAEVKRQVSLQLAEKLATAAAAERLVLLQKDLKITAGFTAAAWISRNKPANLTAEALEAVMSANVAKLPIALSMANTGIGTTLYVVTEVRAASALDPKVQQAQAQQIVQLAAQADFASFMMHWRDSADVKIINPLKQASTNSAAGS
ncbi:SurA N-terminal domain containing protein [Burkholderiaceae bacterium]|jgi:hypothetical protein